MTIGFDPRYPERDTTANGGGYRGGPSGSRYTAESRKGIRAISEDPWGSVYLCVIREAALQTPTTDDQLSKFTPGKCGVKGPILRKRILAMIPWQPEWYLDFSKGERVASMSNDWSRLVNHFRDNKTKKRKLSEEHPTQSPKLQPIADWVHARLRDMGPESLHCLWDPEFNWPEKYARIMAGEKGVK